jgi:hypothetical protein
MKSQRLFRSEAKHVSVACSVEKPEDLSDGSGAPNKINAAEKRSADILSHINASRIL